MGARKSIVSVPAKAIFSSAFICSAVGLVVVSACTLLAAISSGVACVERTRLPASSNIEVGVVGGTVVGSAAVSGAASSGGSLANGGGGVARLNATLVAPVRTPPPRPPLRPESKNRTKLSSVKKFLFWSTNFSAAAVDISWAASVPPSVNKPCANPLPKRLTQPPINSSGDNPLLRAMRIKFSGVIASNTALNPPDTRVTPSSSLPVDCAML